MRVLIAFVNTDYVPAFWSSSGNKDFRSDPEDCGKLRMMSEVYVSNLDLESWPGTEYTQLMGRPLNCGYLNRLYASFGCENPRT